ncbi:hypothetical protein J4455_00780 [Candidatus Woesearchaeota archaeon]|nr:hypothetical protein [Candidatus Woesearchaeota archaeon]
MVNKKAFIKTFEAIAAIILVLLVITYVFKERPKETSVPKDIALFQSAAVTEIYNNETKRACIFIEDKKCLDFSSFIPSNLEYNITICKAPCPAPPFALLPNNKTVYAKSFIVASNLTHYDPKLVSLYVWRKI